MKIRKVGPMNRYLIFASWRAERIIRGNHHFILPICTRWRYESTCRLADWKRWLKFFHIRDTCVWHFLSNLVQLLWANLKHSATWKNLSCLIYKAFWLRLEKALPNWKFTLKSITYVRWKSRKPSTSYVSHLRVSGSNQ